MDMKKVIAIGALAVSFLAWRMGAMTGNPKVMIQPQDGLPIAVEKSIALRFVTIEDLYTSLADQEGNLTTSIPVRVSSSVLKALIKEIEGLGKADSAAGKSAQTSLADMVDCLSAAQYLGSSELVEHYTRRIAERLATDDGLKELSGNTNIVNKIPYDSGVIIANLMPERSYVTMFILPGTFTPVAFSFSPDGNRIACACSDISIRILDARTGTEHLVYRGHSKPIESVRFSPDGENVVSASEDGTAQIWNAKTGKPVCRPLVHMQGTSDRPSAVNLAMFSPDGKLILTTTMSHARIWDAHTGQFKYLLDQNQPTANPFQSDGVFYARFSPDGKEAVVTTRQYENNVKIWDLHTGQLKHTLAGHADIVDTIDFTADGTKFLTKTKWYGSNDYTVKVWNLRTGALLRTIDTQKGMLAGAISPAGDNIITVNMDALNIWNMQTGAIEYSMLFPGRLSGIGLQPVFSPDVSRIMIDTKEGLILFDVKMRQITPFVSPINGATRAVFSFDGKRLFIDNYNTLKNTPSAAAIQLLPASSLPGVNELDAKIFVALLSWAHTKKAKIVKTDWVVKMLRTIQWNEVEAWDKKLLQSWIREVMEHNIQ